LYTIIVYDGGFNRVHQRWSDLVGFRELAVNNLIGVFGETTCIIL